MNARFPPVFGDGREQIGQQADAEKEFYKLVGAPKVELDHLKKSWRCRLTSATDGSTRNTASDGTAEHAA